MRTNRSFLHRAGRLCWKWSRRVLAPKSTRWKTRHYRAGDGAAPLFLLGALAAFLPLARAQVTIDGSVAVSGGVSFVDGDEAAFQQRLRQRKYGYGGVEDFSVSR